MSFLSALFGNKKPTSGDLDREVVNTNSALSAARSRLAGFERTLANIANLTAEEHAEAERGHGEARREVARLEARLAELTPAIEAAKEREAYESLRVRRDRIARRVKVDAAKILDRYEAAANAAAEAAREYREIWNEVNAVNQAVRRTDIAGVDNPDSVHRKEPDRVTPERVLEEEEFVVADQVNGGKRVVGVTMEIGGVRLPSDGKGGIRIDAERRVRTTTIPEVRRSGRSLPSLIHTLRLPAARPGGPDYLWAGE